MQHLSRALADRYYDITIKNRESGFVSPWILANWKEETRISCSGPLGWFCYEPLRDRKNLIFIAGGCGWCGSRLVSGNVYVVKDYDGRRKADIKFGYFHPCSSFPLSDIEVSIPPYTEVEFREVAKTE